MQLFKLLVIAALFVIAFLAFRSLKGEKSLAVKRLAALILLACGVLAVTFPTLLTKVAHFFGVGRGVDFLLYMALLAGCFFAVAVMRAKARTDARVTQLSRAVALAEARHEEARAEESSHPGNSRGNPAR